MPSSQRRAHGHWCKLEFCISHHVNSVVSQRQFQKGAGRLLEVLRRVEAGQIRQENGRVETVDLPLS